MADPKLNKEKDFAQCYGRSDGVRFIQNGSGFDGAGKFVGKVNDALELIVVEEDAK